MSSFLRSMIAWRAGLGAMAMAVVLSGCVMPDMGAGPQPVQPQVQVGGGALTVAAPRGFCADPKTLRDGPQGAFVLFGHCAAMARDPTQPRPAAPVLLSVTLGADEGLLADAARMQAIAAFFQTDLGRATLARSGRSEDLDLLLSEPGEGQLLLQIRDRSAPANVAKAQVYWRMITVIEGRMASLSVMPLADGAVPDATQRRVLQDFLEAIAAAN
ncbi:MAG: hypothetical protein R3D78_06140 [Paracoccaceae bacterium]|jgi:hypothetical protein